MPRPVDSNSHYFPGLDGLRTIAVGMVIAYHLGIPEASGGLLGVGLFFTLSGFLITSILLRSWWKRGSLGLSTFWFRRFRRLLPAVFVLLISVIAVVAIMRPDDLPARSIEALAAMFYVANWATIARGESYFDRFENPSPFSHLWSLAVEEQFYLLWPLVLLVLLWLGRLAVQGWRRSGEPAANEQARKRAELVVPVVLTLALAAVSFFLLAQLAEPGFDNTRSYEGTDTRVGGILIGAALAMIWGPAGRQATASRSSRAVLDVAGVAGLVVILWLMATTTEQSISIYSWGIAVLSVAVCPVIMAVTTPRTLLAQVLGWTPLRWLGERSYGIYLWHMPIAAFTPRLTQQLYPWQVGLGQVVLTVFLASVSWRFVEDPIRRGALSRPKPDAEGNVASRKPVVLRLTVGFVAIVVLAGVVMAGTMKLPQPSRQELAAANARPSSPSPRPRPSPSPEPTVPTPTIPLIALPEPGAFGQTACHTVVHLGDSTSRGLVSEYYLPDPAQRMDAQYIKAGATSMIDGVGDAMAIVEHWNGEPSGFDRAQSIAASAPPDTCWVVALGLNDAATIAIGGSPFLADDRIDQIMSQVRPGERVMWVTTITQPWADPVYNNEYMAGWNASLIAAMDRYPNMRVYDWAADTATWDPAKVAEYFTDDGIHYTTPGCAMRAHMIARALATAFPAGQEPTKSPIISAGTLADNEAQVFPPPPPPPPEGGASPAASATSQG